MLTGGLGGDGSLCCSVLLSVCAGLSIDLACVYFSASLVHVVPARFHGFRRKSMMKKYRVCVVTTATQILIHTDPSYTESSLFIT